MKKKLLVQTLLGFIFAITLITVPALAQKAAPPAATFTWSATGSMATGRILHTATLLRNGKLLAAGGGIGVYALSMAELYNAAPGGFTPSIFELLLE